MEVLGPGRVLRFGCFELDPEAGELRRDGAKIRLQEQPLQILTGEDLAFRHFRRL